MKTKFQSMVTNCSACDDLVTRISISIIFSLILGACTTPNAKVQYDPASPGNSAVSRQVAGLEITVDPVFEKAQSEQYFKTDALDYGVLPVHIFIKNTTAKTSYLLQKQNFKLSLNSGAQTNQSAVDLRWSGTDKVIGGVAAAAFSPVLIAVAGSRLVSSRAVQFNFAQAELRDQTLSAGGSAEGFVYFEVSKSAAGRGGSLRATLTSLPSQENVQAEFPVKP
jgi:hypothetical protein